MVKASSSVNVYSLDPLSSLNVLLQEAPQKNAKEATNKKTKSSGGKKKQK